MHRNIHWFLAAVIILSAGILVSALNFNLNSSEFQKLPKAQRIQAMAEQEFEMTRDPALDQIPKHRLYKLESTLADQSYSRSFQLNWDERGPSNFSGRVRAILFDANDPSGNTIWSGGVAGGLWKCNNAFNGHSWTKINSFSGSVAVSSIVQDPSDPNIMFVGTGEGFYNADAYAGNGIYKSTDGGNTWNVLPATTNGNFNHIQKLLFVGDIIFACTRSEGVQISYDGGDTWAKSLGNGTFGFSERASDLELAADGTLYASMGLLGEDGVYRSFDQGQTWEFLPFPFSGYERVEIATAPSAPNIVYALPQDTETNGVKYIVKSYDQGSSWDTLPAPAAFNMDNFARNQAWYDLSIGVDPDDENRVFIGGVDLLASQDGGMSWTQISQWYGAEDFQYVHADQHNVQFLPSNPNRIMFSNDGGIWLSENSKSEVPDIFNINQDYNITQFYSCAIHPDVSSDWIIGGTQDNGTHLFTEEGINQTDRILGGDGSYCHIDKDNPQIQIGSYIYNAYWVTLDGWQTNNYYKTENREGYFINPTDYDDVNDKLYCNAEQGSMNVLDIYTGEFDSIPLNIINNARITAIKISPYDETITYIGTNNGRIIRIQNLLNNPSAIEVHNGAGSVRSIEFDYNEGTRMIASYSNYGVKSVYQSLDGGDNWNSIEGSLPDLPVRWAIFNPSNENGAILGTELGVWTTDNINGENTSWALNSENLPLTRIDMLDLREEDKLLVAATHGRGMYTSQSLAGFTAFFNVINYEVTDGFGNMVNDNCPRYFIDSISMKLSTPFSQDLNFEIKAIENNNAFEFEDFELISNDLTIPQGEIEAWVYFRIYENMAVKGNRSFDITAENPDEGLFDSATITILDDEIDPNELFSFVKHGVTESLSSIINPGDSAVYSTTDSLVFNVSSSIDNESDCFEAQILHSGNNIIEQSTYLSTSKIFYLDNTIPGNNFACKAYLDDDEADSIEDGLESLFLLYSPEVITDPNDATWEQFEQVNLDDIGWKKNTISFGYKGPGSYAFGELLNSSSNNLNRDYKLTISPNPAINQIYLDCADCSISEIKAYDAAGKFIGKYNTLQIDVKSWRPGTYYLSLEGSFGFRNEKIIVTQ